MGKYCGMPCSSHTNLFFRQNSVSVSIDLVFLNKLQTHSYYIVLITITISSYVHYENILNCTLYVQVSGYMGPVGDSVTPVQFCTSPPLNVYKPRYGGWVGGYNVAIYVAYLLFPLCLLSFENSFVDIDMCVFQGGGGEHTFRRLLLPSVGCS